jgi:hypothetical protein
MAAVNRRLRSPFGPGDGTPPLLRMITSGILAPKLPEFGECRVTNSFRWAADSSVEFAYALGSPQFIGGYLGAVTIAGAIGAHIAARVPITHAWRPTALSLPKPLARQQTIEVAEENLRTQGV